MRTRKFSLKPAPPKSDDQEFNDNVSSFSTATVSELDEFRRSVYLDLKDNEESINSLQSDVSNLQTNKMDSLDVYDNGVLITSKKKLNFIDGSNISVSVAENVDKADVTIDFTGSSNITFQENGSDVSTRSKLNFNDSSQLDVQVSDDSGNSRCNVSISVLGKICRPLRCYRSAVVSIPNATDTTISWSGAYFNDYGMWSSGQPTRITIPSGISCVEFIMSLNYDESTTPSGNRMAKLMKNGSTLMAQLVLTPSNIAEARGDLIISTGPLPVSSSDYFELVAYQSQGAARNAGGGHSGLNGLFFSAVVLL